MVLIKKNMDLTKITDIEMGNISPLDYPEYPDAYISKAKYDGRPMIEVELVELNTDRDFIDQQIENIFN